MRGIALVVLCLLSVLAAEPVAAQRARKSGKKRPATAVLKPPPKALSRADSLVLRARGLLDRQQEAEALAVLRTALSDNPVQYEALWRASVLCSHIGARYTDETRQLRYFNDARAFAARALEIHPDFAHANYAMALAVASEGSLAPLRGRLAARLEEKPYLDAALTADAAHADAWQLLGRWYFKTANYTVFETLASKLLAGGIPHETTNGKARDALQKAIELNPKRVDYYYDLARMCLLQGKRELAAQAIVSGLDNAELVTTEDLAVSRQLERLRRQLGHHRLPDPDLAPR